MYNENQSYSTLARLCYARTDDSMGSNEVRYWVVFSRIPTIGRARVSLSGSYFGSLEKSWHAGSGEFAGAGLDQRLVKSVLSRRPTVYPNVDTERITCLEIKDMVKQVYGINYIRTCEASVEYQVSRR